MWYVCILSKMYIFDAVGGFFGGGTTCVCG